MNNYKKTFFTLLTALTLFNRTEGAAFEEKAKVAIDDAAESLKGAVDRLGEDYTAIQNYLNNYHWKGILQEIATSGAVTLRNSQFNNHPKACVVKPGEKINGSVMCHFDKSACAPFSMYRVVIGLKGAGAQDTIGNEIGLVAGDSEENFTLTAPTVPGMYQVRFKVVDTYFKGKALDAWTDNKGHEPDGTSTIGLIFVK